MYLKNILIQQTSRDNGYYVNNLNSHQWCGIIGYFLRRCQILWRKSTFFWTSMLTHLFLRRKCIFNTYNRHFLKDSSRARKLLKDDKEKTYFLKWVHVLEWKLYGQKLNERHLKSATVLIFVPSQYALL